jgi:hypothetical protein
VEQGHAAYVTAVRIGRKNERLLAGSEKNWATRRSAVGRKKAHPFVLEF